MKVLVACEFSGIVRDAFIKRGHDAVSCDILPTESAGPHIKKDVLNVLNDGWDMMIGHPPCTYISYAGTHVWNNPGRCEKRLQALEFFRLLWEAPIEKICLENPKSCASPTIAKYSQEIQPYYFGDRHLKTIWLWLKNLPPLLHFDEPTLFDQKTHTKRTEPTYTDSSGKKRYFTEAMSGNRQTEFKNRSKFWPGIAEAMADQWG